MKTLAFLASLAGMALLSLATGAAEPAKDHPLVGRYEGAVLDGYKAAAYDEVGPEQGADPELGPRRQARPAQGRGQGDALPLQAAG